MSVGTAKPFRPPVISTATAAFANGSRGRRRRLAFELGGASWRLRFTTQLPSSGSSCLRISDGASHAWVRLADWNGLPQIAELSSNSFDALPQEVQAIVAEAALASELDAFGGATGSAWRIEEVCPWPNEAAQAVGFELIDDAGKAKRGAMALDAAAADALVGLLGRIPAEPWRNLDRVPLDVRFLIGESRISKADFATLRRGDLLVIERQFASSGNSSPESVAAIAVVGAKSAFEAKIDAGGATLGAVAAAPAVASAESVRFEIAGAPAPLGSARELKPGSKLALAESHDAVRVTRSDRSIARGKLVLCAGSLAVRLDADSEG